MQLDQRTFEQIVGKEVSMGAYREDQRTADRVPIMRKAFLAEVSTDGIVGERVECRVREISSKSAGVMCPVPLGEDSLLVLWVPSLDRKDEIAIDCGVMRCEPCGGTRMFQAGLVFVRSHITPPAIGDLLYGIPDSATLRAMARRIKKAILA